VRWVLRRGRRAAIVALGGVPSAPGDAVPVDIAVRLLFPGTTGQVPPELVERLAPDGFVHNLGQLRALLGATERQFAPSPVTVRFGPEDIVVRRFDRFDLWLDAADAAVSQPIAERKVWEPHTTAVLERFLRPGMTALDIGANVGWFTMLAAVLVGPSGSVIAVEPWSENCRLLITSLQRNNFENVELWPIALDSDRRWAHFMTHVGSNGGFIGAQLDDIASGRGTIVPTFTLDELVGDRRVDLVKIDVEGAEHRVVLGGQRTLERCRPVVLSEFSLDMTRRVSAIDPVEYLRWFTTRGWTMQVVDRNDGSYHPFETPEDLLRWWPAPLHQEDLLFLPA
jgi:FkbM family methyltransferase